MMGRGAARFIKLSEDGPRPGPAHHIFNKSRPGPARSIIFSNVSARLGLAHNMTARPMKHGLYMGRPDNYVGRPVDLTAGANVLFRYKTSMYTLRKREILSLTFIVGFSLLFPVGILWGSLFRPMRHIASTHYSYNPAPPTTRSMASCGHRLLVLLPHPVLPPGQQLQATCVAETAMRVVCTSTTVRRL